MSKILIYLFLVNLIFLTACSLNSSLTALEAPTSAEPNTSQPTSIVVSAPSELSLVSPSSTSSMIATPVFRISGVVGGDSIKLYSDTNCTSEIGSGIATGTSIDITTATLSVGTHLVYAKLTRNSVFSSCSSVLISYTVLASTYVCSVYSASTLGNITNSATSSMAGQSIAVNADYGYVGTSGSTNTGIQIVNLLNTSSPSNVSYISTQTGFGQIDASSNDVLDIFIENDTLYATTLSGGLLIVDVTNKSSPVFKSKLDLTGETWAVAKKNNYVYVGSLSTGLTVIDVTDLSNPVISSTIASMPLRHMQIVGSKIYGSTNDKIQVIDISTPASPTLLGELTVGFLVAYETYYSNGYLYALEKAARNLKTYDVTNPSAITLVNTLAVGSNDPRSIDGIDDKVFIGTGSGSTGEIRTYSISTPASPSFLGASTLTQRAYEVAYLKNGKVVSANMDGKLEVTQVCAP